MGSVIYNPHNMQVQTQEMGIPLRYGYLLGKNYCTQTWTCDLNLHETCGFTHTCVDH